MRLRGRVLRATFISSLDQFRLEQRKFDRLQKEKFATHLLFSERFSFVAKPFLK